MLQHLKTAIKLGGGPKEKNELLLHLVDNAQLQFDKQEDALRTEIRGVSDTKTLAGKYDEACILKRRAEEALDAHLKNLQRAMSMVPPDGYQSLVVKCDKSNNALWTFDDFHAASLIAVSQFGHVHVVYLPDDTPLRTIAEHIDQLDQRRGYDWRVVRKVNNLEGGYHFASVPV